MRALRLGQGSGLGSRGAAAVVPNPTGMTSTAAQQALTAAHLGFAMGATVESDQAAGTVVGQVPGAGERVLQNALVTISTAVPRQVSVPSVVGIALRQARFMLEGFRLTIVLAGGTESDQPPESILTQDPPAGRSVAIGSPARVTVATPRTVIVPQSGADGAEQGGGGTGGVEASDDGDWSGRGPAARRCVRIVPNSPAFLGGRLSTLQPRRFLLPISSLRVG